jgi:hypothetical protein
MTWQEVMRTVVLAINERDDGYVLSLKADLAASERLRGLVDEERRCCRWMTLELEGGSTPSLRISSDSTEGKSAIKTMLGIASRTIRNSP